MLHPKGGTSSATDSEIIQALAKSGTTGWISTLQLSWDIGVDDASARRKVRGILTMLVRNGILDRIYVTHRDQQLEAVNITAEALAALNGMVAE